MTSWKQDKLVECVLRNISDPKKTTFDWNLYEYNTRNKKTTTRRIWPNAVILKLNQKNIAYSLLTCETFKSVNFICIIEKNSFYSFSNRFSGGFFSNSAPKTIWHKPFGNFAET